MKGILEALRPTRDILFRANHVSNQFPLGGTLPKDRVSIVKTLEHWIASTAENTYPPIPDSM